MKKFKYLLIALGLLIAMFVTVGFLLNFGNGILQRPTEVDGRISHNLPVVEFFTRDIVCPRGEGEIEIESNVDIILSSSSSKKQLLFTQVKEDGRSKVSVTSGHCFQISTVNLFNIFEGVSLEGQFSVRRETKQFVLTTFQMIINFIIIASFLIGGKLYEVFEREED